MKIYVLITGSYSRSDYHIVATFTDKEKAEQFQKWFDIENLEEYDSDPELPQMIKDGYHIYCVEMAKDGEIICLNKAEYYGYYHDNLDFTERLGQYEIRDDTTSTGDDYGLYMSMYVQAKDEEHAIKIVNEKRLQLLAEDEFEL